MSPSGYSFKIFKMTFFSHCKSKTHLDKRPAYSLHALVLMHCWFPIHFRNMAHCPNYLHTIWHYL